MDSQHGQDKERSDMASKSSSSRLIICDDDVILGRGKGTMNHPGNVRFRLIGDLNREKYQSSSRVEKKAVIGHVINIVHETGGRFVEDKNNGEYEEVPKKRACQKVSHMLRDQKNRRSTQSKGLTGGGSSSTCSSEDHFTAMNITSDTYSEEVSSQYRALQKVGSILRYEQTKRPAQLNAVQSNATTVGTSSTCSSQVDDQTLDARDFSTAFEQQLIVQQHSFATRDKPRPQMMLPKPDEHTSGPIISTSDEIPTTEADVEPLFGECELAQVLGSFSSNESESHSLK